jgi:hypothetical protein
LSANWDARADSARSISNPTIATTQLLISSDRSSPELTAGADHLPWLPHVCLREGAEVGENRVALMETPAPLPAH